MSHQYVRLLMRKLRTKPSICFYILKHVIISLEHPTAPCSSRAEVGQKLCHMDRYVVIWDELMCREELVEFVKVCQHKIMKLYSAGNSDAPSGSDLSRCNKITEVLQELVLPAIGRQSTPYTTQGYDKVHGAEYSPSISRYLALAFVTNPGRRRRAPRRQCSFLHVVPDFLEPRSSKNTSLATVSICPPCKREVPRVRDDEVVGSIGDSFGVSLPQYVSLQSHLQIAHALLPSELLSTCFLSTFGLSSS